MFRNEAIVWLLFSFDDMDVMASLYILLHGQMLLIGEELRCCESMIGFN